MKKIFFSFFILLSAAGIVVAAGGRDPAALAPLSVYVSMDEDLARGLLTAFTAETGIRTHHIREGSGLFLARMEAERENPQASIWLGGVGVDHITARDRGLTTPFRSRHADIIPPEFRCPNGYWIGLYLGPLAFTTNMDRAAALGISPPRSWADLLLPQFRGHIRMPNPTTSGTAYNMLTAMVHLHNRDEDAAFDFMRRLDANIDQYTRSGGAPGQSVAIGEVPIAIGYAHDMIRLKSAGANIAITIPSEGTGYELAAMSLIAGGGQPVEARRLYDWILSSPVAHQKFVDFYFVMIKRGVQSHPMAIPFDEIRTVGDMAWDGDSANRNRLLDRWNAEIGSRR